METATRRAAIYTRISNDPAGLALGVKRQEQDARQLCSARGWDVVEVFCDNDRSAFDSRRIRPRYLAMLDAVRGRQVDVIVAWHPDRLHRQTRELVPFIDLVAGHGVQVETVTAGNIDLTSPTGRMNARMIGVVAEFESEHKSERIRRKLQANAAAGRHHGGMRPYGWQNDRVTVDDHEAAGVRRAAAQLLAGDSVKSIARGLNDAGHQTSSGLPWRDVTVRDMLLRPRNAALRVHHGEVAGPGAWEQILSASDFHQVEAILRNPKRRTTPGRDGRVHLLSTIATCGVCERPIIVGKEKPYKGRSMSIYRCPTGQVSRKQADVDEFVTAVLVARLSRPDARDLLAEPGKEDEGRVAARRVEELQARLGDAAEAFAAGAITMAQLTTINAAVRPELDQAQIAAAKPDRSAVLAELAEGRDAAEVWQELSPERRRAVVALLVRVRILPKGVRGRGFDPSAIEITWKGTDA